MKKKIVFTSLTSLHIKNKLEKLFLFYLNLLTKTLFPKIIKLSFSKTLHFI